MWCGPACGGYSVAREGQARHVTPWVCGKRARSPSTETERETSTGCVCCQAVQRRLLGQQETIGRDVGCSTV